MSEIVDLVAGQGMCAGMIFDYVPDPPWGPPHRCPGCQPRPGEPTLAQVWDRWQALETKLRKLGESASCPLARGEVFPEPYTNEERVALGCVQTDRLPRYEPQTVAVVALDIAPAKAVGAQEVTAADALKQEPEKPKRKTPTKRATKVPKTPEEQGDLF
jgi:hypothetical protein